ncbi:MAG: glycosyltransferase [Candidatus Aminicenantes bacterium]
MNICGISFHCCPYSLLGGDGTGGMSVYLRELSSSIANFPEVKIDIFTRIQTPKLRGIKNISPHVRIIHVKGGPERVVDRRSLYDFIPEFAENLAGFISREKRRYDVLYSHYWLSGLVGWLLKHKYNVPLVHVYHTLAFLKRRMLEVGEEHPQRLKKEENLSFIADAIISSSGREKKNLVDFYRIPESKTKVIYPGVNRKLFYPDSSLEVLKEIGCTRRNKILLYVGRIEPVKGLMTVIEAFSGLKERNPSLYEQLKLVVVGGGRKEVDLPRNKEFMRINETMQNNRLEGKVIFLGSKEQRELKNYYSTADVLVVPSVYESFGLVVIEALACGTPVIVSQIGEMKTIVKQGKNGFSFRPQDPISLARALERFFSSEKRLWDREKISQNVIQRFSWERTAKQTFDFFHDVQKEFLWLPPDFNAVETFS